MEGGLQFHFGKHGGSFSIQILSIGNRLLKVFGRQHLGATSLPLECDSVVVVSSSDAVALQARSCWLAETAFVAATAHLEVAKG